MGLFKKRTTKSVGRNIGQSIERTKSKEKILRTLEKEKEQREREGEVTERIKALKKARPTRFKKFVAGTKRSNAVTAAQARALKKRVPARPPVRRRRKTVKRKRRRTRTTGRARPRPAPRQEAFAGFRF